MFLLRRSMIIMIMMNQNTKIIKIGILFSILQTVRLLVPDMQLHYSVFLLVALALTALLTIYDTNLKT